MSYAYMDHAGWVERSTKRTLADFQKRAVNILGIVGGGIYNAPINVNKIDWNHGSGISVVYSANG